MNPPTLLPTGNLLPHPNEGVAYRKAPCRYWIVKGVTSARGPWTQFVPENVPSWIKEAITWSGRRTNLFFDGEGIPSWSYYKKLSPEVWAWAPLENGIVVVQVSPDLKGFEFFADVWEFSLHYKYATPPES